MAKILILYYSRTGNTEEMIEYVEKGIKKEGVDVEIKKVQDVSPEVMLDYDGIIIGSPTYYGTMAAEVKQLIDESVKFHGDLAGKPGGAFTSAANLGGGNETTIIDILKAMLIHGMVIQGDPKGDHYGPVAIGRPDERAKGECTRFGENMAKLVKRLKQGTA
jgi:NAD(P)H dehydrogenase (quinone)